MKYNRKEEVWKDVKGYEGYYQVSNIGRVKSLTRKYTKERILKHNIRNGYKAVILCVEGKPKNVSVHRLVATAFIDNSNNYPVINHIDGNRTNNKMCNLEWCTQSHNVTSAIESGAVDYEKRNPMSIDTLNKIRKKVGQYSLDGSLVKIWESALDAQRDGGFDNSCIGKCCKGKRKKHKGFKWKYI